jgi:hypothetical protein
MTDKPSWQAAGFHSPNKQWRQSCRIKARIGQNFRGETVDATRRESADAKKCRMGMTPNDFLFKIRPCFQRPARALFGTDHVDETGSNPESRRGPNQRSQSNEPLYYCDVSLREGVVSRVALKELQT